MIFHYHCKIKHNLPLTAIFLWFDLGADSSNDLFGCPSFFSTSRGSSFLIWLLHDGAELVSSVIIIEEKIEMNHIQFILSM